MRHLSIFTALLLTVALAVAAAPEVTPGVSLELAKERAAHISQVHYILDIDLPAVPETDYTCRQSVGFVLDEPMELQLDYQGKPEGIMLLVVNGKQRDVDYRDEHLILDKSWLRAGGNVVGLTLANQSSALNRHDDYAYTLFVPDHARSAFVCFDQPDLKARFDLTLTIAEGWEAIANGQLDGKQTDNGRTTWRFATSAPLPTYLFSFTCGKFHRTIGERDGRRFAALHRESDPEHVAQLETVFDQIALSLRWMEDYTGIAYPYSHYDFAVLPSYQFGGMEHPGCVQFNDRRTFLGRNASLSEQLSRTSLLAHETAHMWFGNLVTMRWFDDVWTKEVYANFMADKITRQLYPDINHDLNFLKAHYVPALATDRTAGTHPIQQPLANLNQAGLLYGNIIYHKAPIMMRTLERQMGEQPLRKGLQNYLRAYSHGNATWDDLIGYLHEANPEAGVRSFDTAWVKQSGMPTVTTTLRDGQVSATQHDPRSRGLVWAQSATMLCDTTVVRLSWYTDSSAGQIVQAEKSIPNVLGDGYGIFLTDEATAEWMMSRWNSLDDVGRYAVLLTLNENAWLGRIDTTAFVRSIEQLVDAERNSLISGTAIDVLQRLVCAWPQGEQRTQAEQWLWNTARHHSVQTVAQQALRALSTHAVTPAAVDSLYALWRQGTPLLNERDQMRTAYHLAIMRPNQWQEILATQRQRLTNDDRRSEFDFISRGCTPDIAEQDALMAALLRVENRAVEPNASALLSLLNHPMREPASCRHIATALGCLEEVQRTGDIFFPLNWCNALLQGHHSRQARQAVQDYLDTHLTLPEALRNKLLQATYHLFCKIEN